MALEKVCCEQSGSRNEFSLLSRKLIAQNSPDAVESRSVHILKETITVHGEWKTSTDI